MEKMRHFFSALLLGFTLVSCEQGEVSLVSYNTAAWTLIGGDTSICSTTPFNYLSVVIDFNRLGTSREAQDSIVWTGGFMSFRNQSDSAVLNDLDTGLFHLLLYRFPEVDTVAIHLYQCNYSLFIPGAFSPNGDGLNEVWFPYSSYVTSIHWEIRSQHGEFIIDSDMDVHWDGYWDGNRAPVGYYIYRIRYTVPPDGREGRTQGWLELYR